MGRPQEQKRVPVSSPRPWRGRGVRVRTPERVLAPPSSVVHAASAHVLSCPASEGRGSSGPTLDSLFGPELSEPDPEHPDCSDFREAAIDTFPGSLSLAGMLLSQDVPIPSQAASRAPSLAGCWPPAPRLCLAEGVGRQGVWTARGRSLARAQSLPGQLLALLEPWCPRSRTRVIPSDFRVGAYGMVWPRAGLGRWVPPSFSQ